MSNVRVTYSGLISFGFTISTILTGLIFTIIVTRQLSIDEFGTWSLIGSLLTLIMIFEPITSYWVPRHIARNQEASITGIGGNMIFSIPAFIIYLVIIYVTTNTSNADYGVLLFGGMMIPLLYLNRGLRSTLAGYKPQGNSYGLLTFELTKIPMGVLFVYWLDMGITGAIWTTVLAQSTMIIFFTFYIREKLKEKFHTFLFKKWLKNSWLPLFGSNATRFVHLDVTLYAGLVGSLGGLAYVGVAKSLSNLVSMTSSLAVGLYPKVIALQKSDYIEMILKRTLLFTIPILGLTLIFARPGLWIINPIYLDGVFIVYAWAFTYFLYVFQSLFKTALQGLETIDTKENPTIKEFLKSHLFIVPAADTIGRVVYLILFVAIVAFGIYLNLPELEIVFWWGIVGILSNFIIVIQFWKMLEKKLSFVFPIKNIAKYVLSTLVACIISYFLVDKYLIYEESIFAFLPQLIPYVLLYAFIYLGIIYAWDKETRHFLRLIVNEIKK